MIVITPEIAAIAAALLAFTGALLKIIYKNCTDTKDRVEATEVIVQKQHEDAMALAAKVIKLESEREGFMLGAEKVSADVIAAIKEFKNQELKNQELKNQ